MIALLISAIVQFIFASFLKKYQPKFVDKTAAHIELNKQDEQL